MREILIQLRDFARSQNPAYCACLMVFCGISVYMNYTLGIQNTMNIYSGYKEFFCYVALYAVHTLVAYLLYSFFSGNYSFWNKPGFLTLLFLSFCIFAFRAVASKHREYVALWSSEGQVRINQFVFNDLFRLSYLIIPVIIIWFFADRDQPLYGVSFRDHKAKVYWVLLFCMVPLIIGASFLSDFLDYYPRFRVLQRYDSPSWKIWMYELCYGMDFSSIELFFRGFMVMAFARYVGIHAILPMASFYLSIHFGKPVGETVSSFFGGTILGVISYHSRSIFGGIMVHAGIAWLMEIGGYLGNLARAR